MPADVVLASVAEEVALKFLSTVGETIGDPVVLTDGDIKPLPTTPFELVAAALTGRMLIPVGAVLISSIESGGAYTNIDSAAGTHPRIWIGSNDGAGLRTTLIANAVNDGVASLTELLATVGQRIAICWIQSQVPFATTSLANVVTAALSDVQEVNIAIGATNAGGNFTGGNALNTLTVFPIYLDIEVP